VVIVDVIDDGAGGGCPSTLRGIGGAGVGIFNTGASGLRNQ